MFAYFVRRVLLSIPILLGIVTLVFVLLRLVPGDPLITIMGPHYDESSAAAIREQYHLNDSLPVQYFHFLKDLCKGEFGESIRTKEQVGEEILRRFPRTAALALAAISFAAICGVLMGALAAVWRSRGTRMCRVLDNGLRVISLLFISMPSFVLAILFSMGFGYYLQWFPVNGFKGGAEGWYYLVLPAIALGTRPLAMILRLTRASLLEVIHQDYVRTARAKGLKPSVVIVVHALRNALIPVTTAISGTMAALLGGSLFIEIVFSWPGLGKLAYDAIEARDFAVVQGTVLFAAGIFVVIQLLMDMLYSILDPRITYS